ncbi:hypothetical protein B0H15DRAFT_891051 [Mycena belliarum]|uniref:Pentatricopeptide repeat-containing protein n=1 Tax=Mycena belliarum TaxID=1033014 RepID=A0AAD6XHU5_9AGAR|nr:hypothetical protein B0H15DRAFT_891051 [Mycena belliae]
MWNVGFRAGVAIATKGRRQYSRGKITAYLRDLSSFTKDPIWRLVMALHYPQRLSLSEALDASRVPLDEFSRWRSHLYASDIDEAVENNLSTHPSWLVLYLASFKVRTPRHAAGPMMDLSFAHLEVSPPAVQGPLLVIAMMHLARFDLVWPMQRVIDAFLLVPLAEKQSVHFNHLLTAMTAIRQRSDETGRNAVKVLRTMEARQLRLWPQAHSALLKDRHAALQLTGYLQRRMTNLGVVPTAAQLEAYLRVYSVDGAIHDVHRYADTIRNMKRLEGSPEEQASAHANSVNRANTFIIRGQPDSASAFQFLHRLAAKTHRDRLVPRGVRPSSHPRSLLAKRGVNIHDWSAALSVAARDPAIDTHKLIKLFMRARPPVAEFRPTTASHTLLIRGLLHRSEWELAFMYWTKLARSGLPIDEMALSTGLQAATLSGQPAEAFAMLEMYGERPGLLLAYTYRSRPLMKVKLTTGIINMFMTSLHRILRPDLVFRLWDTMEELYNVRPSSETLRIILEAAQLPHTLDDSFSGQIALLALKNPFRHAPTRPAMRAALVDALTAQAAAPYRSGVWCEQHPTDTASRIFLQAALGAPERLHVARLEPPARAVREHPESDSAAPTLRLAMPPPHFALPPDILTPAGRAHFPEIAVREREFAAYLLLLGMTRRAPEIARVLVWMRALDIRPRAQTLGIALAFWGEVSVQPPLIAAMAGRGGDEYLKLVEWLREWCPEVPDEKIVGRWRARIAHLRKQRFMTAGTGRLADEEHIWHM